MLKNTSKKRYLVPGPKARLRQGTFEKPRINFGHSHPPRKIPVRPFLVFFLEFLVCFFLSLRGFPCFLDHFPLLFQGF